MADEHEREKSELPLEIEIHYFFRNKIKVGGKTFSKKNPLNSGFQKNTWKLIFFSKKTFLFSVLFAKVLADWKQINSDVATKLTFSGLLAYMLALPM